MRGVLLSALVGSLALVSLVHGARGIVRRKLDTRSGVYEGASALLAGIFLVLFAVFLVAIIPVLAKL